MPSSISYICGQHKYLEEAYPESLFKFLPVKLPGVGLALGGDITMANDVFDLVASFDISNQCIECIVLLFTEATIFSSDKLDPDGEIIYILAPIGHFGRTGVIGDITFSDEAVDSATAVDEVMRPDTILFILSDNFVEIIHISARGVVGRMEDNRIDRSRGGRGTEAKTDQAINNSD